MDKAPNLYTLIISNVFDMFFYMIIISLWCSGGSSDQDCLRYWDLMLFGFQLISNFLLCGWFIKKGLVGYRYLWINIFWLAAAFGIFSSFHLGLV